MIEYESMITREMVQVHRHKVYVFGDNWQRKGFGGQAKEMRGEYNAVGIITKWEPSMRPEAFFSDVDLHNIIPLIEKDFTSLQIKVRSLDTGIVVIPANGIGTGFAKLDKKAPKVFQYIKDRTGIFESWLEQWPKSK